MNVLIVEDIASSRFGGAERSMRAFCEDLHARGHRLHLVYDRPGDYADERSEIYASTTRVSTLPLRAQSPTSWVRGALRLTKLCRSEQIDLIYTHVVHATPMLRLVRRLSSARLGITYKWRSSGDRVGLQVAWGNRGIDVVTAVSDATASYWAANGNGLEGRSIRVIAEGVQVSDDRTRRTAFARQSGSPLRLGFTGRIVREKGLHVLLDAIARLKVRDGVSVELTVMGHFAPGEGPDAAYHSEVEQIVRGNGLDSQVHFLGFVDSPREVYRTLDGVILPSLVEEAQPLVMLDALAEGVPIVASRIGGIPAVMSGPLLDWLFNPGDVDDLADRLLELEALPDAERQDLRSLARRHVAERYSLEETHTRLRQAFGITDINELHRRGSE